MRTRDLHCRKELFLKTICVVNLVCVMPFSNLEKMLMVCIDKKNSLESFFIQVKIKLHQAHCLHDSNLWKILFLQIYSSRALEEDLTKIKDNLEVADNDWKLRVNEMKKLRGLFKADAYTNYHNEIMSALKDLTRVLSQSVKDLRSQVSREACISVAYICQTMGLQAANLAEGCLPNLFAIVPNSAKIIASSGCTALMYIVQYVHSSKLIPVILFVQTSKAIPCRL